MPIRKIFAGEAVNKHCHKSPQQRAFMFFLMLKHGMINKKQASRKINLYLE
jgi:hypothetical protein